MSPFSRAPSSNQALRLVSGEHVINGVQHVANVAYAPFFVAATGEPPQLHFPVSYSPPSRGNASITTSLCMALPPTLPLAFNRQPAWHVLHEIGDGACFLRTIARNANGTPHEHLRVRNEILDKIIANQDHFYLAITTGYDNELMHILR